MLRGSVQSLMVASISDDGDEIRRGKCSRAKSLEATVLKLSARAVLWRACGQRCGVTGDILDDCISTGRS